MATAEAEIRVITLATTPVATARRLAEAEDALRRIASSRSLAEAVMIAEGALR